MVRDGFELIIIIKKLLVFYNKGDEQSFYETLDMAEQNGVKSLTLLEYNNLNFHNTHSFNTIQF